MTNASIDRQKMIVDMAVEYGIHATADTFGITEETVRRYIRSTNSDGDQKNILLFDIETKPIKALVWDVWKQNIQPWQILEDWSVLTWSAKWLNKPDIYDSASWRDNDDILDDKACMAALHALMCEADVIVAHNGDKFDIKKVNTRFLKHGLGQPSPYKTVDTLKIARKRFSISHNKLDYLGEYLGIGRKVKHEGYSMWLKVMDGDKEAQEKMIEYNKGDIVLLEQVYLALRAWDTGHPNVNVDYTVKRCTVCGHAHLRRDGEVCTQVSTFAAYQCCKCGHWMRGKVNLKDKEDMDRTMRNAL